MFTKINDTQFSLNDQTYTVAEGVTVYKATGIISLDKWTENDGLLNTSFTVREFEKWLSDSYNGDEQKSDWLDI